MIVKRYVAMGAAALSMLGAGIWLYDFFSPENLTEAVALSETALVSANENMETPVVRPIPTAIAEIVQHGSARVFPGKVRANQRAELSFSVGGKLVELNAQEGILVKKGQVLARLDQRAFIHERDAARSKFVQAERNLDKFHNLYEQGVVTQTKFEDVQTAYDIAKADLHIKQKALGDTTLCAPFDGVVVSRHSENFGHVKKEEQVLSLQDISEVEVVIQVPERLLAQDGTDGLTKLQVHFDADQKEHRWFDAAVHEYSVESSKTTRTYDVVVALASPKDLKVLPGMTASVRTLVDKKAGLSPDRLASPTIRVPLEAVWRGVDGCAYVWVIAPEGGHPVRKKVKIGSLRGDFAEIVSGLTSGAHVAVAGVHSLKENVLVRPQAHGKEGLDG